MCFKRFTTKYVVGGVDSAPPLDGIRLTYSKLTLRQDHMTSVGHLLVVNVLCSIVNIMCMYVLQYLM